MYNLSKTDQANYTDNPLISVVVIAYNSSKYIIETLESAKRQTYRNIELIISDDASSDATLKICQNWIIENRHHFRKTKLITSPVNTGIAGNCNRGFGAADGKWIKAIAGDDILSNNCVAEFVAYIKENPGANVVFSQQLVFRNHYSDENIVGINPDYPNHFFNEQITAQEQYHKLLLNDYVGNSSTLFFFKEVMANVGWYQEEYYPDDYQMWLKITKAGHKLHFLNLLTTMYRSHSGAIYNYHSSEIVRRHLIWMEPLKREFCYPNLTLIYYLKSRYSYAVNRLFYYTALNNYTQWNHFIYKLLIKYLNPFWYVLASARVVGTKLNHVKKAVRHQ